MGLVLKYVQKRISGSCHYRRRVPERLRNAVGLQEIVRRLGETENEALRNYPKIHAWAERMLETARRSGAAQPIQSEQHESELAEFVRLMSRIREAGFDPFEDKTSIGQNDERHAFADGLLSTYPMAPSDDPEEVGMFSERVPQQEATFVRALYNGMPAKPAPTLIDAKKFYVDDKAPLHTASHLAKRQRADRVIAVAIEALRSDRKITDIRRADAREVRDHFLQVWPNPSTARRYYNDLRGIVSFALLEAELTITNPFSKLPIDVPGSRKVDREAFTDAQVEAIRARLKSHARADILSIWTILEFTGCRVGEASGLRKDEVILEGVDVPFIKLQQNETRGLKTAASMRHIPLVPRRFYETVKDAWRLAGDSPYLFPRYAKERGADNASAALMRHVRQVTQDGKLTNTSLRHRLKDKLMLAGVPEDVREQIIGHAGNSVRHSYGGRDAALVIMREALLKSFPEN